MRVTFAFFIVVATTNAQKHKQAVSDTHVQQEPDISSEV